MKAKTEKEKEQQAGSWKATFTEAAGQTPSYDFKCEGNGPRAEELPRKGAMRCSGRGFALDVKSTEYDC